MDDQLAVDTDAAVVVDGAVLLGQLLLAHSEEVVELLRVVGPHNHVPQQAGKTLRQSACERTGQETAEGAPERTRTLSPLQGSFSSCQNMLCIHEYKLTLTACVWNDLINWVNQNSWKPRLFPLQSTGEPAGGRGGSSACP